MIIVLIRKKPTQALDTLGRFAYTIPMKDKLISISKAAKILGVSIKTVRRRSENGELKCVTTDGGHRRFHTKYLNEYLKSKTSITFRSEK